MRELDDALRGVCCDVLAKFNSSNDVRNKQASDTTGSAYAST